MKKKSKEALNMFLSAFMVMAYVVCSYYITNLASTINNEKLYSAVLIALVAFFGTLLFYATRVGDGKQVVRFSPSVLIIIVLPALYILCANFALGLPLHDKVASNGILTYLSAIAFGYGVPYTFTSGFEMVAAEDVYFPDKPEKPEKDKKEKKEKKDK